MSTNAVVRVGRDGFTGSPITDWCAPCKDWVVRRNDGGCPWCDHRPKTRDEAREAQREKRAFIRGFRLQRAAGDELPEDHPPGGIGAQEIEGSAVLDAEALEQCRDGVAAKDALLRHISGWRLRRRRDVVRKRDFLAHQRARDVFGSRTRRDAEGREDCQSGQDQQEYAEHELVHESEPVGGVR